MKNKTVVTSVFSVVVLVVIVGIVYFGSVKNPANLVTSENTISGEEKSLPTPSSPISKYSAGDSLEPVTLDIGGKLGLDFNTAKPIDDKNPPRVHSLVPSYGVNGAKQVKGSEINQDIEVLVSPDPGSANVRGEILSIGRYLKSDDYEGVVSPWCESSICNYSFGGISADQAKIVINFKFENTTIEQATFMPNAFRLSSGDKVYAQLQMDNVSIPPYSTVFKHLEVFVPRDVNVFTLEYVAG